MDEVMRVRPRDGICALIKGGGDPKVCSLPTMRGHSEKAAVQPRGRALTRNQTCQLLVVRLPSLQNGEKYMSIV